jgi:hypothetical protein
MASSGGVPLIKPERGSRGRIGDSRMTGFLVAAFAAFLGLAYLRAPAWLWSAGAFLV